MPVPPAAPLRAVIVCLGAGLAGTALPANAPAAAARPVLLELFTSQGCSSCPPADRLLERLGERRDVLALAFHVDYWDGIGWTDRHGSPQWTARQRDYAARRGFRIYTPQLVVDGRADVVGSSARGAEALIEAAQAEAQAAPATLQREGRSVRVTVGTLAGVGEARGRVLLASFDGRRETAVRRGENAGRVLVGTQIVRSLRALGDWHNTPVALDARLGDDETGERLALIVQGDDGRIWALAATP